MFDDLECKDSRNRIAALLGLWDSSRPWSRFKVEYGLSDEQNYTRFAKLLVDEGYLTQIFQDAIARHPRDSISILPSWVPDWCYPATTGRSLQSLETSRPVPVDVTSIGKRIGLRIDCYIYDGAAVPGSRYGRGGDELSASGSNKSWSIGDKTNIFIPIPSNRTGAQYICSFDKKQTFFSLGNHLSEPEALTLVRELRIQQVVVIGEREVPNHVPSDLPMSRSTSEAKGEIRKQDMWGRLTVDDVRTRMKWATVTVL